MQTDWNAAIAKIAPQVVKIETANRRGTGFLCYGGDEVRVVVTAYHVIEDAGGKALTIRCGSQAITFGQLPDRDIMVARCGGFDAALLLVQAPELPESVVPILEKEESLVLGTEIGWLGYPRLAEGLSFFSGRIGAVHDEHILVDGKAIHGVSGGPAFCSTAGGLRIVGSISAYLPNLVENWTFPDLSVVTHASVHRDIKAARGL